VVSSALLPLSDEAFAIAQGLRPHPDKLRIERWEEPEWEEGEAEELFRPGSRQKKCWPSSTGLETSHVAEDVKPPTKIILTYFY